MYIFGQVESKAHFKDNHFYYVECHLELASHAGWSDKV